MAATAEAQTRRWTYEEYCRLEDQQRYEILDGQLIALPAAGEVRHQSWVGELFVTLAAAARNLKPGEFLLSPLDVVLDAGNTVQPDLLFVSAENSHIIQPRAIFGAPDLLVEVISPSSVIRDRYQKKELYARFGVKEYWIADPANHSIEVFALRDGAYQLHSAAEANGVVQSSVLGGFQLELSGLP